MEAFLLLKTCLKTLSLLHYFFIKMGCLKLSYYKQTELKIISSKKVLTSVKSENKKRSNYLYGFNGQEKDNEVSGEGNTYTAQFWEYDSRTGRRWNTDPVVKPNESPYLCFGGNPIYHNDPDGDDYGITTKKDKDGKITNIKVSAKIFIQGDGASDKRAKELTKSAQETYKTKTVDGVEVSFDVQYVYDSKKKSSDLNSKLGENLLTFDKKAEPDDGPGRSHINGYSVGSSPIEYTGNTGVINGSGKSNYAVMHESLHLAGLSDRYGASGANKGYDKDIMGARDQMTLKTSHYRNIIEYTKSQHQTLTPKYPNLKYIYSPYVLDKKYEGGKAKLKR
jgi:hypothetical protein